MFCNQCGSKLIKDNDLFCPYCGAKRDATVPTVNQPETNNMTAWSEQLQPEREVPIIIEPIVVEPEANLISLAKPMEESTDKPMEDPIVMIEKQPKIPEGFVIDRASGWYFKSKGKQLPNGSYVNEITWFEPKAGKTTVVDYPMSEQQVSAMLLASRKQGTPIQTVNSVQPNQYQGQNQNQIQNQNQTQTQTQTQGVYSNYVQGQNQGYQVQQPAYQNQTTTVMTPKKKSKKGLIIGIIAAVVVIALGICTWKFEWYKVITGDVETVKIKEEPTPTLTPTPTPTPSPTPEPENPLGKLNVDYIVIGGQEFETNITTLYLDNLELTNEDIEPLQYMKNLEQLYISSNNITSLQAIEGLSSLVGLDASYNQIYDVVALSDLTNLESLYLDHSQVSDLSPLTGLEKLSALGITYTQVFDLTPLVQLPSLMYLYITNSEVEDLSPLSLMPNLYMCDVTYEPTDPIDPNNNIGGQVGGSYEFTEADNLYFIPLTNNYLVASMVEDSYDQMLLLSYDEYGQCVQMRIRMEVGYELSTSDIEEYEEYFEESMDATNLNYDGSVIYFDYPATEDEFSITKDEVIKELEADNYEIIINVSE
jgi:Leucine-rich repeat (LRR) protein